MQNTAKEIFELLKEVADDVVVNFAKRNDAYIKIYEGRNESLSGTYSESATVFAAKGKRVLLTSMNDFRNGAIRNKVKEIGSALRSENEKPDYFGIAENRSFKYKGKGINFDKKLWDVDSEMLNDGILSAINAAMSNKAEKVHGMLSLYRYTEELLTSGGVDTEDKGTAIKLSLRSFGREGFSSQAIEAARHLAALNFERIGKESARFLEMTRSTKSIESGVYDILYLPLASGNLMADIGDAMSIGNVEGGFSFLAGKKGKYVASKDLSIYDDPTIKDGFGSYAFDEEGVPSKRTAVIKDGKLMTYLHNTSTARKYKTKSTGNAGLIEPQASNIILEHRKSYSSMEKLLRGVDRGILVTNTWYTRFKDYETGEFSTVPRDVAFVIRNGGIESAIKNIGKDSIGIGIRISDRMERMLKSIRAEGGERVQVVGWDEPMPAFVKPFVVEKVKVTAAE